MTKIQEITQCDGPHGPKVEKLQKILSYLPSHVEVRAISINGQAGEINIEVHHEGLDLVYKFPTF
jgi:hypothetical protein